MQFVTCDLCGTDESHPYLVTQDRFSGKRYQLVKCDQCSLIYLNPRPAHDDMAAHYPDDYEAYNTKEIGQTVIEQWHIRRALVLQLDYVEKYARQPGNLLDVGCATGNFMHLAQERGWQAQGIELMDKAANIARQRYGLNVITGSLETIQLSSTNFHVITLWDVLEHLPSPKNALLLCNRLLVEGGWLIFSIPNLISFDRYLFGKYWIGWDSPRHFHLFTEHTLCKLLKAAGFELAGKRCVIGGKGTFFLSLDRVMGSSRWAKCIRRLYPLIGAMLWFYRQFAYLFHRGPVITYVARKVGNG